MTDSKMVRDPPVLLSTEEFESLREVSKGDAQGDIPQMHWERLVALGYGTKTTWYPWADGVRRAAPRFRKRSSS